MFAMCILESVFQVAKKSREGRLGKKLCRLLRKYASNQCRNRQRSNIYKVPAEKKGLIISFWLAFRHSTLSPKSFTTKGRRYWEGFWEGWNCSPKFWQLYRSKPLYLHIFQKGKKGKLSFVFGRYEDSTIGFWIYFTFNTLWPTNF